MGQRRCAEEGGPLQQVLGVWAGVRSAGAAGLMPALLSREDRVKAGTSPARHEQRGKSRVLV